jgi:hypothetical protein
MTLTGGGYDELAAAARQAEEPEPQEAEGISQSAEPFDIMKPSTVPPKSQAAAYGDVIRTFGSFDFARDVWRAIAPESPDDPLDSIISAFEQYGRDPAFTAELSRHWWALLAAPEVIVGLRAEIQGIPLPELDYSAAVIESMYTHFLDDLAPEVTDRVLESNPLVADWMGLRGNELKEDESRVIMWALASVPPERRDRIVANAEQYLRNKPLLSEDDRIQFVAWFYNEAEREQAMGLMHSTTFGSLGEAFAAPFRQTSKWFSGTYARLFTSPEEYKWRQPLSPGQNIAISLGHSPNDPGSWNAVSGFFDFVANLTLDPIIGVSNLAIGAKLARTIPAAGRLANVGKIERAARGVVPWYGRTVSHLPRMRRSPSARLGWALFSKTADEMVEGLVKAGVPDDIWNTMVRARAAGAQGDAVYMELLEKYPGLKNSSDGLFQVLISEAAEGPEWVEQAFRAERHGFFSQGGKVSLLDLAEKDLAHWQKMLRDTATSAMSDGVIDPKTLYGADYGATLVGDRAGVYDVFAGGFGPEHKIADWTASPVSLAWTRVAPRAKESRGAYVVLDASSTGAHLDLTDPSRTADVLNWLKSHPMRGLTARGKPLAEGAAGTVERLEKRIVALQKEFTDPDEFAQALTATLLNDMPTARIFDVYLSARNIDVLGTAAGGILTPAGARRVMRGTDSPASVAAIEAVGKLKSRVAAAGERVDSLKAGGDSTWFIKDFPTHVPSNMKLKVTKPWRGFGPASENPGAFGARFRQAWSNFFFNPRNARSVDHSIGGTGASDLGSFLRQMGADEAFTRQWAGRYTRAHRAERYDIMRDAIEAAAHHVDHPLLQHAIIDQIRKEGLRSYGFMRGNGGKWEAIGMAAGRGVREGDVVTLPFLPLHTRVTTMLPGQEVFTALRRYRRARNWESVPLLRSMVRGHGATSEKRVSLINQYRGIVAKNLRIDPSDVDENLLAAMAYATTSPRRQYDLVSGKLVRAESSFEDGLGWFAHVGQGFSRVYSGFHKGFSIMQLLGRPISWMLRVNLEEQWRMAMFDMPSFFRNPARAGYWWYNSHLVSKHVTWKAKQGVMVAKVTDDLMSAIPKGADAASMSAALRKAVPEFGELLDAKAYDSVHGLRDAFQKFMLDQVVNNGNLALLRKGMTPARFARIRAAKIRLADKKLTDLGLETKFSFDELPEIRNKGMAQAVVEMAAAGSYPLEWSKVGMTGRHRINYANAWAKQMHDVVADPLAGSFGLGRLVERGGHGGKGKWSGAEMINHPEWLTIRQSIRRQAEYQVGANARRWSEVELADWYLGQMDNMIDGLLRPILGSTPEAAARVAAELRRGRKANVTVGNKTYTLDFDNGNFGTLAAEMRRFVEEQRTGTLQFPERVSAFFEPRYLGLDSNMVRGPRMENFIRNQMAFWGDDISQYWNRRPAWLSLYSDHMKHYKALGWSDEMAAVASRVKASDTVNYVLYQLDNVVPFLRKANKVSPFFSAWWEVVQTWSYKIPMQSAWGLGYPAMMRKVNRFMDALISMGVLEVGDVDPASPQTRRQLRFNFSMDPNTKNPLGQGISKAGFWFWRSPGVLFSWLTDLTNWDVTDLAHDLTTVDGQPGWKGKTQFTLAAGSPVEPFGHGIGAVNQLYISVNPAVGFGLTKMLDQVSGASDYQMVQAEQGESLQQMVDRLGMNWDEFRILNRDRLMETLGPEAARRLFAGDTDPNKVVAPTDVFFKTPDSNLWATLAEDFFLPYGRMDTLQGTAWAMAPGWFDYFMRGLAVHMGGAGSAGPGEDLDVGAIADGFLRFTGSPQTRSAISGEIITQMQYLEATEGLLTKLVAAEQELGLIEEEAQGELVQEILADGTSRLLTDLEDTHPLVIRWHDAYDMARTLSDEFLHRATSLAAGSMMVRGSIGLVSPGVPGMLYEQNRWLATYYYGRDVQRATENEGELDLTQMTLPPMQVGGQESYDAFLALLGNWLADPQGDTNRIFLREHFPEMLMFTYPKSYWGPGGQPPEVTDMEEWGRQVADGTRQPFDPVVYLQRAARSTLRLEQEIDIRDQFGELMDEQAVNVLNDWYSYSEITKDYAVKRASLAVGDELFYDNAYSDWVSRNDDDNMTLLTRLNDWVADIGNVLFEISDSPSDVLGMFDPAERRVLRGQLKQISSQLRTAVYEWRQEYGEKFEPNERDSILADYFAGPIANYYEGLGDLYEQIDTATDSNQRTLLYNEIRRYEEKVGLATAVIQGHTLPSPLAWRWGAMSQEQQEDQLQRWVATRPDWLSAWSTGNIVARDPALAQYFPTKPSDFEIYDRYAEMRVTVKEMARPGLDGAAPLISTGKAGQIQSELNDRMREELMMQGREAEVRWMDMTPLQRLSLSKLLPEQLEQFVPMVNASMDALSQIDKSPSTGEGRRISSFLLGEVLRRAEANPTILEAFEGLGQELYDEIAHNLIIMKLFMGELHDSAGL